MCTPVAKFGGLDELLCFQFIQKPLSTLGFRIFFRSIQNQEWKRSFTERPARSVHDLMGRMVSSACRLAPALALYDMSYNVCTYVAST